MLEGVKLGLVLVEGFNNLQVEIFELSFTVFGDMHEDRMNGFRFGVFILGFILLLNIYFILGQIDVAFFCVDSDAANCLNFAYFHGPLNRFLHRFTKLVDGYHSLLALILEELNIASIFLTTDALHHDEFIFLGVFVLIVELASQLDIDIFGFVFHVVDII